MNEAEAIAEALSPHIFAGVKALGNRTLRDKVEQMLEDAKVALPPGRSDLDLMVQITSAIVGEWGNASGLADTLQPSSLPLANLLKVLKTHEGDWSRPDFKEEVQREVERVGVQLRSLVTDA
jgi:hypothetical protein